MKRKWANFVKDYLTYTRNERIGLLSILAIILAIIFIPLPKPKVKPIDKLAIEQELGDLKIYTDSSRAYKSRRFEQDDDEGYTTTPTHKKDHPITGTLFPFDPNTLDAEGWERLGVRERTVQTILKLVGKGFKFRKPEDIKKIYGLRPEEADRLVPYVQIKDTQSENQPVFAAKIAGEMYTARPVVPRTINMVDVNEADTSALIALPGIGSKLAARIINFREKLGGYSSVLQVAETYALPDSTFQKIKDRLVCKTPKLRTININTADANLLKGHPYLKWNTVNAIIAYRQQHGPYKSISDLKKIEIITDEFFDKIAPYLVVSD